jgi:hypothetical protein
MIVWRAPTLDTQFSTLIEQAEEADYVDWTMFGSATTEAFALAVQLGEPVDFLHVLPKQTKINKPRGWAAVIVDGIGGEG